MSALELLICDGSVIPRSDYAAGGGSATFNIPDLRGRVAIKT